MTNEKLNQLMKEVDKQEIPKSWNKFIERKTKNHNLIIKYGKKAFCTHCQKYFDKEVFIKRWAKAECPYCKRNLYIRNHNTQKYSFFEDIGFYAKVDSQLILRIFEIKSDYNPKTRKFDKSSQEYARVILGKAIAINNSISFFMWHTKIYHNTKIKKWHIYTGIKRIYDIPIYPYNKKKIFKGTKYEYAPIAEFKRRFNQFSEFEVLKLAECKSFELLWKMGLYNLSKDAEYFNKDGSFSDRFGVPKSFLKFMVDNNLDYNQYMILKLMQEPNIDLIRSYNYCNYKYLELMYEQGYIKNKEIVTKFCHYWKELETICQYIPLRKLLNYQKGLSDLSLYADYLSMLEELNYKMKSKNELFPEQLLERHNELMKKIEIQEDMNTHIGMYRRYLELYKYTYSDKDYIVFPVPTVECMKDEGEQQNHCVARDYMQKHINKECEIFFMREQNNINKSLITIEFRDNKVKQARKKDNYSNLSKKQENFISKWCEYRDFIDKKAEYNKQKEIQLKNYKFNTKVA